MPDPGADPSEPEALDAAEYRRRWTELQAALRDRGIACAVLAQSRNVLYHAGMAVHGHVVLPAEGDPVLLVQIDHARASAVSAVPQVLPSRGTTTLVGTLADLGCDASTIGIEEDFLTVTAHRKLRSRVPRAELVDVAADVAFLRRRKSPAEIALLRRAAAISDEQFALLRSLIRPGVTEVDVYAGLGHLQRRLGADGVSAKHGANDRLIDHAWVVSGPNTAQVSGYWLTMSGAGPSPARPYGPTTRTIERGDLVCCDVGTAYHGYHVDHARSLVLGPPTSRQQRCWEALLEVQDRTIGAIRPGRSAAEVYAVAETAAEELGIGPVFMTAALHDFRYVGHGVGLEIDEGPLLAPGDTSVLDEGMVLAVEPKVIDPGWGGMTVEDTVVVTAAGASRLTGASRELQLGR